MTYRPVSLVRLLGDKNRTLLLPHIQRPFVWEWDQVVRFIDSLLKDYPIQTLLTWRTREAIRCRRFMDDVQYLDDWSQLYDESASEAGFEKTLVLDGQQRLQTLFAIFAGKFEGESVYINLASGEAEIEDGLHFEIKRSPSALSLPWLRISALTNDGRNAEDISDQLNGEIDQGGNETPKAKEQRRRRVRRTVSQLSSILREDRHLWYEELDGVAANRFDYPAVLSIFVRVNSGGTKLDSSDLMFALMKEGWDEIEKAIEEVVHLLNGQGHLSFDKNFVLKCLLLASGKGASLSPSLFQGDDGSALLSELELGWPDLLRAFQAFADFVHRDLMLYHDKTIRSYNSLVPVFQYIHSNNAPSHVSVLRMRAYFYRAQLFSWYSARTDQQLEVCSNILKRNTGDFPLQELSDHFGGQGKATALAAADVLDIRQRFIVLNAIYVAANNQSPFAVRYKGNEPHIDHIYPKSKLKELPASEVNHIGNYRFVGATDNIRKRAEEPSTFFQRLADIGVDIGRHLLVQRFSADPSELTRANYETFRDARANEIFKVCAGIVNYTG